ncbi:hypothetical protein KC19_2G214900 [Ceratodon purpureus]|uniref:Uncharacterized protein n=1 Tax=Ceratodon purpureus TaxID=3225 RepID=A0A8T0IZB7_CERPU|nr:hypothetical protein KC19_2G214900 [Ceratodon purpureus]
MKTVIRFFEEISNSKLQNTQRYGPMSIHNPFQQDLRNSSTHRYPITYTSYTQTSSTSHNSEYVYQLDNTHSQHNLISQKHYCQRRGKLALILFVKKRSSSP